VERELGGEVKNLNRFRGGYANLNPDLELFMVCSLLK
jgi:hypothetical protein